MTDNQQTCAKRRAAAWPAIVRIVQSAGTPEDDAERAKIEAERERLVTIECYEAMHGLPRRASPRHPSRCRSGV
jgi:hypothetical protein